MIRSPQPDEANHDALRRSDKEIEKQLMMEISDKINLKRSLAWFVTIVLLAYMFATTDLSVIFNLTFSSNIFMVAALLFLAVFSDFLYESWQIKFLLAHLNFHIKYKEIAIIKGYSLLFHVINYNVGTVFISYYLKRKKDSPMLKSLGSLIVLNLVDVFNLSLICSVGILWSVYVYEKTFGLVILPFSIGLIAMFLLALIFWRFEEKLVFLHPLTKKSFFDIFRRFREKDYLKFVVLRLPIAAMHFTADFLVLRLFGIQMDFSTFVCVYPAVVFIAALPISISGLGSGQMAARIFLLGIAMNIPLDDSQALGSIDAFSSSLIIMTMLIKAAIGLYFFLRYRYVREG